MSVFVNRHGDGRVSLAGVSLAGDLVGLAWQLVGVAGSWRAWAGWSEIGGRGELAVLRRLGGAG